MHESILADSRNVGINIELLINCIHSCGDFITKLGVSSHFGGMLMSIFLL